MPTPKQTAGATFGARLRQMREAKGLSVQALAAATGLHRQSVYQWERGEREPTWAAACKLADALGCGTDALR